MLGHTREAQACSCAPRSGIEKSVPTDGATGVPTNVVPWVKGAQVELVGPEGQVVPTTLDGHATTEICIPSYDVIPDQPLEPSTQYKLVAKPMDPAFEHDDGMPKVTTFTTGGGPEDVDAPPRPEVEVVPVDASEFTNSCISDTVRACLFSSDDVLLDVRFRGGDGRMHYVGWPQDVPELFLGFDDSPGCLEIRARSVTGALSEPVENCFDPASLPTAEALQDASFQLDCQSEQLQALRAQAAEEQPPKPEKEPEPEAEPDGEDLDPPVAGAGASGTPEGGLAEGSGCSVSRAGVRSAGHTSKAGFLLLGLGLLSAGLGFRRARGSKAD